MKSVWSSLFGKHLKRRDRMPVFLGFNIPFLVAMAGGCIAFAWYSIGHALPFLFPLIVGHTILAPPTMGAGGALGGGSLNPYQNVFNVKASVFGARGDGVADDTAAVQAAINAAIAGSPAPNIVPTANRTIFFPAGRYKISNTLSVTVNASQSGVTLHMVGDGYPEQDQGGVNGEPGPGWGSALTYTGLTGDLLFLKCGASANNSRIRFFCENLAFVGNKNIGGAISGGGLHFQSLLSIADVHSVLNHVYVMQAKDNGIWLDGVSNCQWYNVQSNQNGLRGVYVAQNGSGNVFSPESGFYGCETSVNGSHGLEITASSGQSSFHSWSSNQNVGKALVLGAGNQRFHNFEAEVNQTSPVIDIPFGSNNNSFFGAQTVYFATTDVGFQIDSFGNYIYGWNSNGVASQIELVFNSGNAHHNKVQNWLANDLSFTGHITDNGYANLVELGAAKYWGATWPVASLYTVSGAGTVQTDQGKSDDFVINITANVAATIRAAAAVPPQTGFSQRLRYVIKNNSGGALTTPVAWTGGAGQFRASGTVSPANGLAIVVEFEWDQVANAYLESARGAAV